MAMVGGDFMKLVGGTGVTEIMESDVIWLVDTDEEVELLECTWGMGVERSSGDVELLKEAVGVAMVKSSGDMDPVGSIEDVGVVEDRGDIGEAAASLEKADSW